MISPPQKILTVLFWLAPFCFLSLCSPLVLLAVPIGVERLLSSLSSHWGWGGHYTAPLAPLLAMSAGDGLSRVTRRLTSGSGRWDRLPAMFVALSMVLALVVPGHQPLLRLLTQGHYRIAVGRGAAAAALGFIPPDASVVAQASLLPHLSQREKIYVLNTDAPDADYVVACTTLNAWPLSGPEQIADLVQQRRVHGYATIFEDEGWVVLKSPNSTR
jgi:uncharacterized membrane protein